ncbi:hypothetical protein DBR17_16165 [Sphingomonas sp. HMWF008]|nr:hypothetical protein DBR17_16165 [Sphingomonas sp. HMWF008]
MTGECGFPSPFVSSVVEKQASRAARGFSTSLETNGWVGRNERLGVLPDQQPRQRRRHQIRQRPRRQRLQPQLGNHRALVRS